MKVDSRQNLNDLPHRLLPVPWSAFALVRYVLLTKRWPTNGQQITHQALFSSLDLTATGLGSCGLQEKKCECELSVREPVHGLTPRGPDLCVRKRHQYAADSTCCFCSGRSSARRGSCALRLRPCVQAAFLPACTLHPMQYRSATAFTSLHSLLCRHDMI